MPPTRPALAAGHSTLVDGSIISTSRASAYVAREPTRRDTRSADLEIPTLSGYALAGSPPFDLGHVRLRIPICEARREPILRRPLLDRLNRLDRLVSRRQIGKLGNRRHIDKNAQNEQANDVQCAHELGLTFSIGTIGCIPRIICECACTVRSEGSNLVKGA